MRQTEVDTSGLVVFGSVDVYTQEEYEAQREAERLEDLRDEG